MKPITRERLETMKTRAVNFLEKVVGDPARAAEVAAESLQAYADRKGFHIENPARRKTTMTNKEMKDRIDELESANEQLSESLAKINELASDAYTPEATRATLAAAIGSILELSDVEDDDDEDDDDDESGDDDEDE